MKRFIQQHVTQIEWFMGAFVVIVSSAAWLSRADLARVTIYDIFPPLGLIAFGLMWTHFVMGALRRYGGGKRRHNDIYMAVSMGLVLGLILLHPGLLWLALYMDGYGLPPESYLKAYSTQVGLVALGSLSLVIFLAFELKKFFGRKSWWKYVEWLQIVGMAAIFIHAIGLGNELKLDWFFGVWVFYGITLAGSIIYARTVDNRKGKHHGK